MSETANKDSPDIVGEFIGGAAGTVIGTVGGQAVTSAAVAVVGLPLAAAASLALMGWGIFEVGKVLFTQEGNKTS